MDKLLVDHFFCNNKRINAIDRYVAFPIKKKGKKYVLEYPELGIYLVHSSIEGLDVLLFEELDIIWRQYVLEDFSVLDKSGVKVWKILTSYFRDNGEDTMSSGMDRNNYEKDYLKTTDVVECNTDETSPNPESVKVLMECIALQKKKSQDYQNPSSNVTQAMHYRRGIDTLHDACQGKLYRAQSLLESINAGHSAKFESLEDSYMDLINYASFCVSWLRQKMPGQDNTRDIFNNKRLTRKVDDYTKSK